MKKKNLSSSQVSNQKVFMPNNKEVPVQQIAPKEAVNERTIEEAVKELNPDRSSMESRG